MTALGVETSAGNLEGKEVRFGAATSAIWASATTAASNGSVNSMHDSYTPLGGLVPMWLMQLGEVVYGGVGSGLYGMLVFAIIAVFIAGLMVGRTPEYLGKKIQAYEMKMASLVILIPPFVVLVGTALAVVIEPGVSSMSNPGVHGFSQVLYAFSSAGNNNGSAFAGLSANTPFYNSALGVAMWLSRYWLIVPVLAIAGSLAAKKFIPASSGTLPTHTPLFVGLLIGTVLLVGALTFVPALALGPIVEHLMLFARSRQDTDMTTHKHAVRTFEPALMGQAVVDSLKRMTPMAQWRNPVMFVTWLGALLTTVLAIVDRDGFTAAISVWLWFTVLFANFAEALAEGRGKAQAASLRGAKKDTPAIKLDGTHRDAPHSTVNSSQLRKGDVVLVEAGQLDARATATSSTAWPRSTSRPSPASRPRSCARPAAIARR